MITVGLSYIGKHSWWLACSQISTIWVSSKKDQKCHIGWPQQPPTEKVPKLSEKLDFWWSIPQNRTSIGHFGARDDQTIQVQEVFWGNWAVEASVVAEAAEVNEAWKITRRTSYLSVQVLELNNLSSNITLFWFFEKKKIFWQYHKISCWILASFISEAV
jgi:hypothetical protein